MTFPAVGGSQSPFNFMNQAVSHKTNPDHYVADACIVWCFDDRFSGALTAFAKAVGMKNYDLVKIAGGANVLSMPENEQGRSFVLNQIEISLKLHHTKRVVLMMHKDCGACGGSKAFGNDEQKELAALKEKLAVAKKFIEENLSQKVPVDIVLVDFEGIMSI